jgi:hypothetical protein
MIKANEISSILSLQQIKNDYLKTNDNEDFKTRLF